MEPNINPGPERPDPLAALPPDDDGPLFTEEEFADMRRQPKKPPSVSSMTQEFVVRLQRGQNEAALPQPGEKIPLRAAYNAVGQLLYLTGTQTQYSFIRLGRAARKGARLALRGCAALVRFVCGPLWALLRSIWDDLAAPFRYFFVGMRNMRGAARAEAAAGGSGPRAGAAYLKEKIHIYRKMLFRALGYLLPVAAFGVLFFTVREMLNTSFSLGVTYNDNLLVFIENEGVWDSAEKMVQERVLASAGAKVEWDAHPEFELRIVDPAARMGVSELADRIITASSDKIMKAVGVRVNGTLVSVIEDGRAVQQLIDDTLERYNDGTHVRVEYMNTLEQVPGLYFTNSVKDTATALRALETGGALNVRVTDRVEYDEVVPYTDVEEESEQFNKGVKFVSQYGRDGVRHVVAEQTSVNGEVLSVVPVEVTDTVEMRPRITTVGTREHASILDTAVGGSVVGTGSMIFPVPELTYVTTRFGEGGHYGVDLCAPAGSPILAADAGVVIEAGWHWSYGNYILIDHGNGITTRYAHCSALLVGAGTGVSAGQQIAQVGSTGVSSGNHCHFEVTVNGQRVDPAPFIGI